MPLGGLVTLAVLLPNILFVLFPPSDAPAAKATAGGYMTKLMEALERIGRIGSFAIPFFYAIEVDGSTSTLVLTAMALALGFYYAGWARYVLRGRSNALLFAPLMGIPLPMAVSPVLYFLLASVLLRSAPLAVAAAVLGVGHIYVSWGSWQQVLRAQSASPQP